MSGHQAIGPGKAVGTSGLPGVGCRCVEAIIGCQIGGSSIGGHAGRAGISSPDTGSVNIGIAATDMLMSPKCPPLPSSTVSALSETTCYTGAIYSQGENTDIIIGVHACVTLEIW